MKKNQEIIHRFYNGECSAEELHEVYRLFGTKEFEKEVLDYLGDEWESFDENGEYLLPSNFENLYQATKKKSGIKQLFTFNTLKIAASIALICTLSFLAYWQLYAPEHFGNALAYQEVTTQRGETKLVHLSDGSEIMLNAASKLKYPTLITEENHDIHIEGSAYFKVKNQLASLVIYADEISAEVSGASFNVSAYPEDDEIVIAVEDGGTLRTKVPMFKLSPSMPAKAGDNQETDPDYGRSMQTLLVQEEEYFSYNKKVRTMMQEKYDDHREYFAWTDGTVFFNEVGMEQMLKQLSRRFDVDFDLKGCIDSDKTFSGEYKDYSLKEILSQTNPVISAEFLENKHRVILTGKCN